MPHRVIQYCQQTTHHPLRGRGIFGVFMGLWGTGGLRALYAGIYAQLGQAVLGAAIMMMTKESIAAGVRQLIVGRVNGR